MVKSEMGSSRRGCKTTCARGSISSKVKQWLGPGPVIMTKKAQLPKNLESSSGQWAVGKIGLRKLLF